MKIAFYINKLSDGGAERVIANLSNFLVKKHTVYIINSYRTENEYFVDSKVSRFITDDVDIPNRIFKNKHRIKKLISFINDNQIDVLISFMEESNFRACLAKKHINAKLIVSVRNDPKKEYPGLLGKYISHFLMKKADGCVFQTSDAKKYFPKKIQKNSMIIMNAVKPDFFECELVTKPEGIVTFGRLTKQKNHKLLIEAFNEVKDKISENLYIYGKGELYNSLQDLIERLGLSQRVFLMGETDDVCSVLKRSKIFCLSSDYEGMPNALMEAMAVGVPSISTNCPCGGPKMIITQNKNGILVPVGNKEKLAESIIKLLEDKNLWGYIAMNSKKDAKIKFDSDVINNLWLEYIESIYNK